MFRDGLGERRQILNPSGSDKVEVLCLRSELTTVPSFEFALRERVSHLAQFRHACYARVRSVERLNDSSATLALVSDFTDGVRMSALLEAADRDSLPLDINAALCLIRQIVPAVAMLHEAAPQVSHGALAPERIIVTPNARVVLSEYVLGAALEQLRYSQERYWKDLRVAAARVGGLPRFDHRSDVTALGVIALSLIVARPLRDEEFPARLPEVLGSAWAISSRGGFEPLPAGLRAWLSRTLQLDARNSFSTIAEAQTELDRVLGDSDYLAAPSALETVLAQYRSMTGSSDAVPPPPAVLPQAVNDTRPVPPPIAASSTPIATPAPIVTAPVSAPVMALGSSSTAQASPQLGVLADSIAAPRTAAPAAPKTPARPAEPVVIVSPRQPAPPIDDADEIEDELPTAPARNWKTFAIPAAIVVVVLASGGYAAKALLSRGQAVGTVAVTTTPPGAQLLIDGVLRGTTPATVTVPPGAHTMIVRVEGSDPRVIPITVTAGAQVSQYLDLPKTTPAAGQLQVRTEPAGAQVSVDGVVRGPSPVTVADLAPGDHAVMVESELGKVEQTVSVTAGTMASVVVPLSAPRGVPVSGWIAVNSPTEVQLYENGKLLGSSQMDRLMVSAGSHQIELVNEAIGYRMARTVQVAPGKVSSIKLEMPKGTLALNAIPWADVWIDGEKVGETPIGNIQVTVGTHDVVFRNPDLGEQKHTVVVSLATPARLSVDLRKK